MKTGLVIGAAAFQFLVLGYLAGEREWIARTGRVVHLRTAPLDPRDVMRGDYVRLTYEISRVPRSAWRDGLAVLDTNQARSLPRDTPVYASLRLDEDGLADLVSLSDKRPAEGPYIRGRAEQTWPGFQMGVRYGVEAYFMQQGTAFDVEQGRNRGGIQVPLEMELAVSPGGRAVLKGHRWSRMGIGLDLQTASITLTNRNQPRPVIGATVRLFNNSDRDLAIVDLPGGRSLALLPNELWGENRWKWANEGTSPPRSDPANVIVLNPGQQHAIKIDFSDAWWYVRESGGAPGGSPAAKPLNQIGQDWSAQFRLVYRPPDRQACQGLPNADLVWHGRLPSRAFSPLGRAD
jgi:uncharacterized membrane-anchored protein